MLLQCVIEMCVVRNYALAVVFITAAVLSIGTGGQQVTGLDDLLLARGVDTAIGCVVALRVFVLMTRCTATARVPAADYLHAGRCRDHRRASGPWHGHDAGGPGLPTRPAVPYSRPVAGL
jgi:hypothetical protein